MVEITKHTANYTRQTVHSKKEIEIKINNIINDLGKLFTEEKIALKGKSREDVIQMVLKIL